jgi:hypothetical protein
MNLLKVFSIIIFILLLVIIYNCERIDDSNFKHNHDYYYIHIQFTTDKGYTINSYINGYYNTNSYLNKSEWGRNFETYNSNTMLFGWTMDKNVNDFDSLVVNLIKEKQYSRANAVKYLIERIKLNERNKIEVSN